MTTFDTAASAGVYPPSNLNRDDLWAVEDSQDRWPRPDSRVVAGLKRAWRTSDLFQSALAGHVGTRTKKLIQSPKRAEEGRRRQKHKPKSGHKKLHGRLRQARARHIDRNAGARLAPARRASLDTLIAQALAAERHAPADVELDTLLHEQHAIDVRCSAAWWRTVRSGTSWRCTRVAPPSTIRGRHRTTTSLRSMILVGT